MKRFNNKNTSYEPTLMSIMKTLSETKLAWIWVKIRQKCRVPLYYFYNGLS